MAGIYIHIPFCKKACHYCDFHFSTSLGLKDELLSCLHKELKIQAHLFSKEKIKTIYFGGGTPSMLSAIELQSIIDTISREYKLNNDLEISIETNPDDLDLNYLKNLKDHSNINRLSIGIQSFHEQDLTQMNRAHNAQQAHDCIEYAKQVGFDNLTVDLIFGAHTTTDQMWHENLKTAVGYKIPHLSIYGLTVEPKTALAHFIKSGKYPELDDPQFQRQFKYTQDYLLANEYEQYEVSNYATGGCKSKHNSAYWDGIPYLGIGPSAHSFIQKKRYWNVANNKKYIEALRIDSVPSEMELLSEKDQFNEYLMTGLRTAKGCQLNKLFTYPKIILEHFWPLVDRLLEDKKLHRSESHIFIPQAQRIMTDSITQELFYID